MVDNNFGFCFGSVLRSLLVGASTIFSPSRRQNTRIITNHLPFYFPADRLCEHGECCLALT